LVDVLGVLCELSIDICEAPRIVVAVLLGRRNELIDLALDAPERLSYSVILRHGETRFI
jgi:hypothetical protein